MAEEIKRTIFQGTELKFGVEITSEGFSMQDDDFKVVVKNMKHEKEIRKEDMLVDGEDNYIFTLDTSEFGTGDYWAFVYAYVPDADFDDGLRTEIQKIKLCTVMS